MADENVQPSESTQGEQQEQVPLNQSEATEHQQSDSLDTSPQAQEGQETEVSPLEPGGDRFKQVWARAKEAEREKKELAEQLQREREERIRLEERQKVQKEAAQAPPEKEYTWEELEVAIGEGKITRAQAQTYREELVRKKAVAEAKAIVEGTSNLNEREKKVVSSLEEYKGLVPEMMTPGTPERKKLEAAYQELVNDLGYEPTLRTQYMAARQAFGDISTLKTQAKLKQTKVEREGHMETLTNQRPPAKTKDPVEALDARQKDHYTRMIKNGRYGSFKPSVGITADHWAEVRKELTYQRPK